MGNAYTKHHERIDVMNALIGPRGTLTVRLTHMEGRLLLAGATVEVLGRRERYTTDRNGTVRISLPAPPRALSLQPNPPTRPYSVYDIRVSLFGYVPVTVYGLHIFDGIGSIWSYNMVRLEDAEGNTSTEITVPAHQRGTVPPYGGEDGAAAPTMTGPDSTVRPVRVPEMVTVHLGSPGSDAVNVTVPFVNYIKSVASSEIFPTWPRESLLSNIHAETTLVLNRIYTEWYPSQGYEFDVSASPAFDQYYVHQREVFDTIDALVDEYFDYYVARIGTVEPIFAQFCDGRQSACSGLSQWGTVDLAAMGYNALDILRYYYGQDVELRQAELVRTLPDSYGGTPLAQGSSGEAVLQTQNRLNRIAVNYPAIPFITLPEGDYNSETARAVRAFQQTFGLPQTGAVDEDTWYRIIYIYNAVKRLGELESEGETEQGGAYPNRVVKIGERGPNVLRLQWYNNAIARSGQFPQIRVIDLDGIYDTETANAMGALQALLGLPRTGEVDRATWDAVTTLYNEVEETGTNDQYYGGEVSGWPRPYGGTPIRRGDRGDGVYYIQDLINALSAANTAIPKIGRDGVFGAETERAVIAFQTAYGLTPDGIVGPLTWEKLNAEYGMLPSVG